MKTLKLIQSDPYLQPFAEAINGRYLYAVNREKELTNGAKLSDWANGYMFYGLHKVNKQWVLREWAPNATAIYLVGDCNNWQKDEAYRLQPRENGVWEVTLADDMLKHEQLYKLLVEWQGGCG
jgi:1,4-alpha-glucan branching enzyme